MNDSLRVPIQPSFGSSKDPLSVNRSSIAQTLNQQKGSKLSGAQADSLKSQEKSAMNYSQSGEVDYAEKIHSLSQQINNQVVSLDKKLDAVLEKHEKDFLTAYRYHMLKVQKELIQLKQKAQDQEIKTQQEEKINNLDRRCQELRSQCMGISKQCKKQEQTIRDYEQVVKEQTDDREFLDQEIRNTQKQNKVFKASLSKNHNQSAEMTAQNQTARGTLQAFQQSLYLPGGASDRESKEQLPQAEGVSNQQQLNQSNNMKATDYKRTSLQHSLTGEQTQVTTARKHFQQSLGPESYQLNNSLTGPSDLQKTQIYNVKFTQFAKELLEDTADSKLIAESVEQYFKNDMARRQEMANKLRSKLRQQSLLNQHMQTQRKGASKHTTTS